MRMRWIVALVIASSSGTAVARATPHHKAVHRVAKHEAKRARRMNRPRREFARPMTRAEASGTLGQSIGAPWAGHLADPTQLADGDGYHIRRPWRSFGTQTTVDFVQRVLDDNHDWFPHVLAIGDLSAEHGGQITEHHSHQSGRDADIGLFYTAQPANYPASFVHATADNLDCAATWKLLNAFAATARQDGGAQIIFLDYGVQGILYRWAKAHGVDDTKLDRLLQYPHGAGSANGIVRHFPNHDNHMHVRFKCPSGDSACR
jgi:murein endopeptidase